MTIALIAHDEKKLPLLQFVEAYKGILANHKLVATAATGNMITEATKLKVECEISGVNGGAELLASHILYNNIDLVIFLRDPDSDENYKNDVDIGLIRVCDSREVPIATNFATAEPLIFALHRGELNERHRNS